MLPRDDLGRKPCVVEVDQRLVVDQDVPPPGPRLQLREPPDHGTIVMKEAVMCLPVPLNQSVADEQIP